ncbi:hypothetical protein BGY98DRAFT_936108 [Russula aff. rugulosa BPL654]|nr:hypothetical protein BGY98DRAFT_936108 [Russula aff. rugulosa BPL654]
MHIRKTEVCARARKYARRDSTRKGGWQSNKLTQTLASMLDNRSPHLRLVTVGALRTGGKSEALIQRSNNDRKGAVAVAIVRHQDSITLPALPAWTEMLVQVPAILIYEVSELKLEDRWTIAREIANEVYATIIWRAVKCKNKDIAGCCQGQIANLGPTAGQPYRDACYGGGTMEETTAELGSPGILSCPGIVELVGMVSNTGKREDQRRVKDRGRGPTISAKGSRKYSKN